MTWLGFDQIMVGLGSYKGQIKVGFGSDLVSVMVELKLGLGLWLGYDRIRVGLSSRINFG